VLEAVRGVVHCYLASEKEDFRTQGGGDGAPHVYHELCVLRDWLDGQLTLEASQFAVGPEGAVRLADRILALLINCSRYRGTNINRNGCDPDRTAFTESALKRVIAGIVRQERKFDGDSAADKFLQRLIAAGREEVAQPDLRQVGNKAKTR
jgi:hypothetical protein